MNVDAPVLVAREGAVVMLRLNRPSALNAADVPMATALLLAVRTLASDRTVRAVLLSGAGRGFMAGGDLEVLRTDPVEGAADLIGPLHEAVALLAEMNAPLIAQVHGVVAGAGLSLMLQADFVIAADNTKFNLAYANVGTSCDCGASWYLPRLVGLRRALEIAILGDTMGAEEAQRIGMINRAVPAAELEAQAMNLAQRLARGPTRAIGHMRRLMRQSFDRQLGAQLAAEASAFAQSAKSADFRIGVEAFLSKQKATFTGQ